VGLQNCFDVLLANGIEEEWHNLVANTFKLRGWLYHEESLYRLDFGVGTLVVDCLLFELLDAE
jgi:hypothetical protein